MEFASKKKDPLRRQHLKINYGTVGNIFTQYECFLNVVRNIAVS
jgi:hypothetical protein